MKQKMLGKTLLALIVALALAIPGVQSALAQEACAVDGQSTDQVISGITLTWDSSFSCENAPESGDYTVTVTVQNNGASTETAVIDSLTLSPITPLPGGSAPSATANVSGLPITLAPGESGNFQVSGSYEMAQTDEGLKISLHLQAGGHGMSSNESFQLGIIVHLSEDEADSPDDEDDPDDGDDPSTGFYCQQSEEQHPFGARLAERYGTDYAILQAWFCEGFGWGQIMLALQTGQITGGDPAALLAEHGAGAGWGDIWQSLGLIGRSEAGGPPNDADGDGRPDFAGPPNDEDGDGKPDFAGPPPFAGPHDGEDDDENDDNGGPPDNPGPPNNGGGGGPP